ncbi:MAG: hypothetical protein QXG65_06395 [Thermoplasmata archaeon]
MFSRREREYLLWLSHREDAAGGSAGTRWNPGYQRKLLWGIRRKAAEGVADLELYVAAAERDARVIPSAGSTARPEVIYTDPILRAARSLRRALARLRRDATGPSSPSSSWGTTRQKGR